MNRINVFQKLMHFALKNLSMHTFHKCAFHERAVVIDVKVVITERRRGIRTGNYAWTCILFYLYCHPETKATTTTTETHTHTHTGNSS